MSRFFFRSLWGCGSFSTRLCKRGLIRVPLGASTGFGSTFLEIVDGIRDRAVIVSVVLSLDGGNGQNAGVAGGVFGRREAVRNPAGLVLVHLRVVIEQVPRRAARSLLVPGDPELPDVVPRIQGT